MWNIPPLCSMFLLLTEWVDIWLGTDLNTKRFSRPRFQVPSNYPFAGCNSLQGRPTGEQNRGGSLQRTRKIYSKCFTSQGILEKCASPQSPGIVCLGRGLSIFLSLADWQRGGGLVLQSERRACPKLTPDLHRSSWGLHLCHLIVLSVTHWTLALDLGYSKQDVFASSALQQHWRQNNFAIRAKSLSRMPRSAPKAAFLRGNTVVKVLWWPCNAVSEELPWRE